VFSESRARSALWRQNENKTNEIVVERTGSQVAIIRNKQRMRLYRREIAAIYYPEHTPRIVSLATTGDEGSKQYTTVAVKNSVEDPAKVRRGGEDVLCRRSTALVNATLDRLFTRQRHEPEASRRWRGRWCRPAMRIPPRCQRGRITGCVARIRHMALRAATLLKNSGRL